MTGAAPSGVVTFLFTDVEGSTRRWEADAHAGGACRTRRGAAQRDRDAQGRVVQTHRRRRVRSILVAEVRCRCRRGRAAGAGVAGADGAGDRGGRNGGTGTTSVSF